jgi:uncharacterized membrane protein
MAGAYRIDSVRIFPTKRSLRDSIGIVSSTRRVFMSASQSKFAVLIAAAVGTAILAGQAQAAEQPASEKCYGVAKAGKNDCQTPTNSCAEGQLRKDRRRQPDVRQISAESLRSRPRNGGIFVSAANVNGLQTFHECVYIG